jgi:hypothetical protein
MNVNEFESQLVARPDGPALKGQENSAQGWSEATTLGNESKMNSSPEGAEELRIYRHPASSPSLAPTPIQQ